MVKFRYLEGFKMNEDFEIGLYESSRIFLELLEEEITPHQRKLCVGMVRHVLEYFKDKIEENHDNP